jgi:hypothetical protein
MLLLRSVVGLAHVGVVAVSHQHDLLLLYEFLHVLVGISHDVGLHEIECTCLSTVKSPLMALTCFSMAERARLRAYLPDSMVMDETSQVYLGAPMMKILTS